tara:strand:+ start:5342 stop:7249 length:1908 start_codon:yes stop_codon:yes gene_type:complete
MPASTLQLVSYGAQDMYLTGNPQITYFKIVYRRHTNFSMEDILLKEKGKKSMSNEETLNIEARKYGDLFHKLILSIEGNLVYQGKFLANPSTALIDHVSMNLDGHEIDKLHGDWIETWYELTKPNHNGTCSNLTYINDHSLTHLSSSMDLALCHYDRHSIGNTLVSASDVGDTHIGNANGPTNGSRVAVFLNDKDHSHTYYNTRLNKLTNIMGLGLSYPPTQFQKTSKCGGVFCSPSYLIDNMNNSTAGFTSASFVDYAITDTSLISTSGSDGLINASKTRNNASGIVDNDGIKNANTGSILGNCTLDIPFYFSKDPGLSIPLISLQTSSLIFNIKFNDLISYKASDSHTFYSYNGTISNKDNCFNAHDTNKLKPMYEDGNYNFKLEIFGLYIYLDTDERRRFAQISHEYLIEQVQFQRDIGKDDKIINLDVFTHPVKEIIWIGQPYKSDKISNNDGTSTQTKLNSGDTSHNSGVRFVKGEHDNISGGSIKNKHSLGFGNASDTAPDVTMNDKDDGIFKVGLLGPSTPSCLEDCKWELKFDEQTRTGKKNLQYYTRSQIDRYHTGYGSVSCPDSIAVYSFALKPEEHQPSGTCNFSKLNKVTLSRSCIGRAINVYAVNYNILRIAGGQASLAYNL